MARNGPRFGMIGRPQVIFEELRRCESFRIAL